MAQEEFVEQRFIKWRGLGAIAATEDGDVPAGIAKLTRKLFHHRRFPGSADRQISDSDDLDAERFITQQPDVVKPPANFDKDLENFRAAEEKSANEVGFEIVAFIKNDFEDEGVE